MGMKYIRLSLCLALTMGASLAARSQTSAYMASPTPASSADFDSNQPGSIVTIQKRVNEVNVLFIAMDKHGKFVRDLNQNDFTILDDHKPPQSIINFRREVDLPLDLGLLIDVIGSVNSRFGFEKEAATGFLQHT